MRQVDIHTPAANQSLEARILNLSPSSQTPLGNPSPPASRSRQIVDLREKSYELGRTNVCICAQVELGHEMK